jgi:hypothetical protein
MEKHPALDAECAGYFSAFPAVKPRSGQGVVYSFEQLIIRIHPESVGAFRGLNQYGLVGGVNAGHAPGQFQGFFFHAAPPFDWA